MATEPGAGSGPTPGERPDVSESEVAYDTTVKSPTILIVDASSRAKRFATWLEGDFEIRIATSRSQTFDAFDETVAVAIVRNELASDLKTDLQDHIAAHAPFCRAIITTTEQVEIMFPEIDYDVCLTKPIDGETLRETVYHLMLRARYDANLCNYYQTSVQATNLEVQLDDENLKAHPRYERLSERLGDIKQRLEAILYRFDRDDLDAVQQTIKPDVGFGRDSSERNNGRGDKYRPDKCVSCGLEWGVHHGSDLKDGCRRLGAFVWECRQCGSVQNLPDPSHRAVAWR